MLRPTPRRAAALAIASAGALLLLVLANAVLAARAFPDRDRWVDGEVVMRGEGEERAPWLAIAAAMEVHPGEELVVPPSTLAPEVELWIVELEGVLSVKERGTANPEDVLFQGDAREERRVVRPEAGDGSEATLEGPPLLVVVWVAPVEGPGQAFSDRELLSWMLERGGAPGELHGPKVVHRGWLSAQPAFSVAQGLAGLSALVGLVQLVRHWRAGETPPGGEMERALQVSELAGLSLQRLRDLHVIAGVVLLAIAVPSFLGLLQILDPLPAEQWPVLETLLLVFTAGYVALVVAWAISTAHVATSLRRWRRDWSTRPTL